MQDKLHIGVIGAGGIFPEHMSGFRLCADRCRVVAVAKANPGKAEVVHRELGPDVAVMGDYRELLARPDIDAVEILLPHDLHMPVTIDAAHAGKHVLVEKVMARNLEECDRMIEACEEAGVSLTVAHDRRYHPDWMAFKRVIDSGILGEIYYWKLEHNQDVALPPGHWIRSRDALGGGAIMSCLTHQLDGLRWFAGEVDSVNCMCKVIPSRMEGETVGVVSAVMRSGALAQVAINWATRSGWGGPDRLWGEFNHATGSKGEIYYLDGKGTFLMLHDDPDPGRAFVESPEQFSDNTFMKVRAGNWRKLDRCVTEWIKLLHGEPSEISTTGRDARSTVELAEAAYRAEACGQTVSLPIAPMPWG